MGFKPAFNSWAAVKPARPAPTTATRASAAARAGSRGSNVAPAMLAAPCSTARLAILGPELGGRAARCARSISAAMLSRALSRDDLGMPGFLARVITKPSSRAEAGDVTFLSARFLKRLVRIERRTARRFCRRRRPLMRGCTSRATALPVCLGSSLSYDTDCQITLATRLRLKSNYANRAPQGLEKSDLRSERNQLKTVVLMGAAFPNGVAHFLCSTRQQ